MRTQRLLGALAHPITEYHVSRAKARHRKGEPFCAVCWIKPTFWGRNNDVHHRVPVHVAPGIACEDSNLVTLCRSCHWNIGHMMNWQDWNKNLDATMAAIRKAWTDNAKSGKHG